MGLTLSATGLFVNILVVILIVMQLVKHWILYTRHVSIDNTRLVALLKTVALASIVLDPILIAVTVYNQPRTIAVLALWALYILTLCLDMIVSYTWYKKNDDIDADMYRYPALLVATGFGTILLTKMLSLLALVL